MLSVIADSARVEVWYINQTLLDLLPTHVQAVILNRLRSHQHIKVTKVDKRSKPREYQLERVEKNLKKAMQSDILSTFQMISTKQIVKGNPDNMAKLRIKTSSKISEGSFAQQAVHIGSKRARMFTKTSGKSRYNNNRSSFGPSDSLNTF